MFFRFLYYIGLTVGLVVLFLHTLWVPPELLRADEPRLSQSAKNIIQQELQKGEPLTFARYWKIRHDNPFAETAESRQRQAVTDQAAAIASSDTTEPTDYN